MADCANCGAPNSPECENCTQCGKPVGGRKSTIDREQTGTKTIVSVGHVGSYGPAGNWGLGTSPPGTFTAYYPTTVSTTGGGYVKGGSRPKAIGPQTKPPAVYVIPQIEIPVANTAEYGNETSSNTSLYTPATAAEIGNGAVDYVKFAEKMQADANQLAADLQALKNAKGVSGGGAGGGVPDGPDCEYDVDYPANTFTIEVKSKFQVIPCEDPVPSEFTCSAFTVTGDGTEPITITDGTSTVEMNGSGQISLTNGTVTVTINGGTISFSGVTAMDLPAGTTLDGDPILTELPNHKHSSGTYALGAANNIVGNSGNPT